MTAAVCAPARRLNVWRGVSISSSTGVWLRDCGGHGDGAR
jgi:hypothetical protein